MKGYPEMVQLDKLHSQAELIKLVKIIKLAKTVYWHKLQYLAELV